MSTIVILIHGFNVWDGGRATVGKLRPFFADCGIPYVMINYGWVGLLGTRLLNRRIARTVARAVNNAKHDGHQVIVVGHSNGCAIAHLAAQDYSAEIDLAVYINPALDADIEMPANVGRFHVWHSPSDVPVKLSKLLLWCDARPWGEMGATGFTGIDSRVLNLDKEFTFNVSSSEHGDMFTPEKITYFGPIVAGFAAETVGKSNTQRKGRGLSRGVQAGELRETGGVEGTSAAG